MAVLIGACSSSGGGGTGGDGGGTGNSNGSCQKAAFACGCGTPSPPISGSGASECRTTDFPASYPSSCCNWGGSGSQCECAAYVCGTDGTTCRCDWGPANDTATGLPAGSTSIVSTCKPSSGQYCCQDTAALVDMANVQSISSGSCVCSTISCDGSTTFQVDHCGADNPPLPCPASVTTTHACQ